MTLLIASFHAQNLAELARRADMAWKRDADAAEVRVDGFGEPHVLNSFLKRHSERQWIITRRTMAEGGQFAGSSSQAGHYILEAIKDTGAWMDIEFRGWKEDPSLRREIELYLSRNPAAKVMLSAHIWDDREPELVSLVEEMLATHPQAIAKVACFAGSTGRSFSALDIMHQFRNRVLAICMGEAGTWTRVLAKKLRAFATYASLSQEPQTASGQLSIDIVKDVFRWESIDEQTRVYGVVGDPVAHSLSPHLHNHWFAKHGCNAVYVPLRIERGELPRFLAECDRRPWLDVGGLSVTIPHKLEAVQFAGTGADPMSREIGAANTLVRRNWGWEAYNTDSYAAVDSLATALGNSRPQLAGLTVDVLGTGGAARAVCHGLSEMGCILRVFGRSRTSRADFEHWGADVHDWEQRFRSVSDVLVNCTPMGMWPDADQSPMPPTSLEGRKLVFDLVYRPLATRLLEDAKRAGCRTLGGLDMFVRQAATQFALWTGITPVADQAARQMLEATLEQGKQVSVLPCVALIGARGSGKTTVGKELARLLGVEHIDTDETIQTSSNMSISQIFSTEGEAGFRRREKEVVRSLLHRTPAVISLGGGAVLDPENVQMIRNVAKIVWLGATPEVLAQRIKADPVTPHSRPPLAGGDAAEETAVVLRSREHLYRAMADFIVDTSNLNVPLGAQEIAAWLRQEGGQE